MTHHPATLRKALLDWYDKSGRSLPWRIRPEDRAVGSRPDPYKVWLSEIMLQQTTIPHATPYWQRFIERWPGVNDLARAKRDDVMAAWAGLGYYARARNMHACAIKISEDLGGLFPDTVAELKELPSIGDYTANAIAAICFDRPATVVDGNVERVISRQFAIDTPLPKAKADIKTKAAKLSDPDRPGDYAQAIMDLGAVICTPKKPACGICVWRESCRALAQDEPQRFPVKAKKKARPVRYGTIFHITRDNEEGRDILLRRRPDNGLLGGMMELPGTEWTDKRCSSEPPFQAEWQEAGEVRHVFTHFELRLQVLKADTHQPSNMDGQWQSLDTIDEVGLPSVMKKAVVMGQG